MSWFSRFNPWSQERIIKKIEKLQAEFKAGERVSVWSTGYDIIGLAGLLPEGRAIRENTLKKIIRFWQEQCVAGELGDSCVDKEGYIDVDDVAEVINSTIELLPEGPVREEAVKQNMEFWLQEYAAQDFEANSAAEILRDTALLSPEIRNKGFVSEDGKLVISSEIGSRDDICLVFKAAARDGESPAEPVVVAGCQILPLSEMFARVAAEYPDQDNEFRQQYEKFLGRFKQQQPETVPG